MGGKGGGGEMNKYKFPAFHGAGSLITALAKVSHAPILSQKNLFYAIPFCLRSILILPSHPRPGLGV